MTRGGGVSAGAYTAAPSTRHHRVIADAPRYYVSPNGSGKPLGGADQKTLKVFFENDIHYFDLRRCFFTHGRPSSYFVGDAERARGRKELSNALRAETSGEGGQTTAGG